MSDYGVKGKLVVEEPSYPSQGRRGYVTIFDNGRHIARVLVRPGVWTFADVAAADKLARLFALAPDLLAAFELLTAWVDRNVANPASIIPLNASKAAIKKAKGG